MILPFSTKFPNGKPTYFIDKIWDSICELECDLAWLRADYIDMYRRKFNDHWDSIEHILPKKHTMRQDAHNRWKTGMKIHFVINNRSKLFFRFAPVIECKSVQKIEIRYNSLIGHTAHPECYRRPVDISIDGRILKLTEIDILAKNDGFECISEFLDWFNEDFTGKIIHWTDLKY